MFGRMYLRVILLEDYMMILGLDFMRKTQTFPFLEKGKLFIIRDHRAQIVPMVKKSSVGYHSMAFIVVLYETDPELHKFEKG